MDRLAWRPPPKYLAHGRQSDYRLRKCIAGGVPDSIQMMGLSNLLAATAPSDHDAI